MPWFVAWYEGKPDFRTADTVKFRKAIKHGLCWLCGQPLGRHHHFVVGPMCTVNHLSSEPPSHLECARFAAAACPFLTRPRAKRREAHLPDDLVEPGGVMVKSNPGACAIWESRNWTVAHDPNGRPIIDIGEAISVEWWTEGRRATRAEAETAFDASCNTLRDEAETDSPEAVAAIELGIRAARRLLPALEAAP